MKKAYLKLLKMLGRLAFGDKWKGYKTMAANWIVMLLGAWTMIDGSGVWEYLCVIIPSLCDIQTSTIYGGVVVFIGALNQILRAITTTEIPSLKE